MNIKKIMIGAAFCAACSVLSACSGGGGGGTSGGEGGAGEDNGNGGNTGGGTTAKDYAPESVTSMRLVYAPNNWTFNLTTSGAQHVASGGGSTVIWGKGSWTYKKVGINQALVTISNLSYTELDRVISAESFSLGLNFKNANQVYVDGERAVIDRNGTTKTSHSGNYTYSYSK